MTAEVAHQEAVHGARLEWRVWRRILGFAAGYRPELLRLAAAALVTAGCDASLPLVTRGVVDALARDGAGARLWPYAAAYLGLAATLALTIRWFIRLAGHVSTHVAHDIRAAGFARLVELSPAFHDRRPVGWLMARMTSDCDRLARIVAWGSLDLVWGVTVIGLTAGILVALDLRLALVVLLVMPALALASAWFQRRILASARAVRRTSSRLTAAYSEELMAVRDTKALGREAAALEEFRGLAGEMFRGSLANARQAALFLPIVSALGSLAVGLALWRGGVRVPAGELSLGTLVAFLTYAVRLFDPFQELARLLAELQMAGAAAERVVGLVDTEPEVRDAPAVRERVRAAAAGGRPAGTAADGLPDRVEEVEFRDVTFGYGGARPVVEGVSFRARRGETVALVGPTGGGKTTLLSLLVRFYDPTSGSIRIDGVDTRERSLDWLQSTLGIVLQTPHLFRGTIAENIRYGRLDASAGEVEDAAREVGAHEAIAALPAGYDTGLGEGGAGLSLGQKSLIALARARLRDPRILVLDEATASVDTETERRIQAALARVVRGRLSFVIAHRLSTIRAADRILVVAGGRIVEQGTHAELLARRGRYHELYLGQRLGVAEWAAAAR